MASSTDNNNPTIDEEHQQQHTADLSPEAALQLSRRLEEERERLRQEWERCTPDPYKASPLLVVAR